MWWKKKKDDSAGENTYIVVGLGNPGQKYDLTRHNIGFMTIDYLSDELNISVTKIKHNALLGEGRMGNKKIVLVKPQTFMNLSGKSVMALLNFYKIPIENLIVIYDDIDIEHKELRLREKGSAGTHNGMKSIINSLGEQGFPRVRMGIGRDPVIPLHSYVLNKFSKSELKDMGNFIANGGKAAVEIIEGDINSAMNKYNGKY